MPLPSNTPVGAFTNLTVAAINQALAQAGLAATTGNVFYCDPVNGLDTNNGLSPSVVPLGGGQGPVQSLQAGYNLLRSGFNDVLVLIGNGTSTGSARLVATFTWAKNAAHLIGVCAPSAVSQRARIANATAAAAFANFFVVSGNGCLFSNLSWFQGFAAGIAAEILVTITGSRNAFLNCDFEGMGDATGAGSSTSRILLISGGGQENAFYHCNFGIDTVQRTTANATIEFQNGSTRNTFEDCTFPIDSSDGNQFIIYAAAAAALDRYNLFKRCVVLSAVQSGGTALTAAIKLAAAAGGMIVLFDCMTVGVTTIAADATSAGQIYAYGPATSTSAYLAGSVTS
jgi:hypothetical protein